jgi:hypothetical protein
MDIISKIQGLMAKADRTDNEHEREAFYAKAQELIVKHAVDEADLAPEEQEKIVTERRNVSAKKADHQLYHLVGKIHNVRFISIAQPLSMGRQAFIVGYPTDISFVDGLVASLIMHRETELQRATAFKGSVHGKEFNNTFRTAYAKRVFLRLRELHAKAENDTPGSGLVLVSRGKEVERAISEKIGPVRAVSRAVKQNNGSVLGDDAGRRANIHGGRNNLAGRRNAIGA